MTPFLFSLPWLGLLLFEEFVARFPSQLPKTPIGTSTDPRVSVIVPARNEAVNIVACVESLTALDYADLEIIVVDDRSEDDTGALARSVAPGGAREVTVVEGAPLPDGWLGKPWACAQGASRATGDLLLFTDADTTHGPALLARAVAGHREEGADLLTVVGKQLTETFWERLVQPHVFFMMLLRFPDFERTARNGRWREAIANGQYMLFSREAYDAIGGHEAVRDEVVEDLALAQLVKRRGLALRARSADDDLATRMYRSLGELVEGWSKNLFMGGLQSFPHWMRPMIAPVSLAGGFVLWLLAPGTLLAGVFGWMGGDLAFGGVDFLFGSRIVGVPGVRLHASPAMLQWAATVYLISAFLWMRFSRRMEVPGVYGLLYPLGAAVGAYILLRSWMRGRTVEWKGRRYRLPAASTRP